MSKHMLNALPELVLNGVISEETATQIRQYYARKPDPASNRLVIVFGILGAILVGLGIVLIIAHNWDDFGKGFKLFFALLPLLIGQGLCAYAILKKQEHKAWRESTAAFLIFGIASSISIVSQVYNIEGNLSSFLLTWMLLTLPVIYVMRSSIASMLFIIGITWYACELSYFNYPYTTAWWYWILLVLSVPHYFHLLKKYNNSNFFHFHSWLYTISIITTVGMFAGEAEELVILIYMNVLGSLVCIGQLRPFSENRLVSNAFLVAGSLGTVVLLLTLSFDWYWHEVSEMGLVRIVQNGEAYTTLITTMVALVSLGCVVRQRSWAAINVKSYAFVVVLVLFVIGLQQPFLSHIATNLLLFFTGVFTIRSGALQNRLSVLNYGLLILTALIICRFFDTDISFVMKGLLFVAVGAGFFMSNYWMIKKRRNKTVGSGTPRV